MRRVLITGITGFLGSHIAERLINNNVEVIGLKRVNSDLWRCTAFENQVLWVDIDENNSYKNILSSLNFDTIIHCAWIGVESDKRNDWNEQVKNINFLVGLFDIAKAVQVKKIVFLGSQAEYGNIDGIVDENQPVVAHNAYAGIKLGALEILKSFCELNNITWIWLRLFSVFGEKENSNWLIPSLVKGILSGRKMDFTLGKQKYAYLYVRDFASIVNKVIENPVDSGIYNVSSNQVITIRSLIENIRDIIKPEFQLNFGALNYRKNQSMHIEGDVNKLFSKIGEVEFTDFNVALRDTINHYINK